MKTPSHLISGIVSEVYGEREQHDRRVAPGRGLLRLPERALKPAQRPSRLPPSFVGCCSSLKEI